MGFLKLQYIASIKYHSIVKEKMTHMYNCIQAFQFEYFPTFISLYTTLLSKEIYIYKWSRPSSPLNFNFKKEKHNSDFLGDIVVNG